MGRPQAWKSYSKREKKFIGMSKPWNIIYAVRPRLTGKFTPLNPFLSRLIKPVRRRSDQQINLVVVKHGPAM